MLVSLVFAVGEALAAWLTERVAPVAPLALTLLFGATCLLVSTLLCALVHAWRRRRAWLAPACTGAGLAGTLVFLRIHAASLLDQPWLGRGHLQAAGLGALAGGAWLGTAALWAWRRRRRGAVPIAWIRTRGASLGAWLLVCGAFLATAEAARDRYRPRLPDRGTSGLPYNVLMVTVDTLRRDHLAAYGHSRPVGAGLEEFDLTRVEGCQSTANWTRPTTASLLTGLYPGSHTATAMDSLLPPEARTLTEVLAEAGLVTGFFSANHNASDLFHMAQGADATIHNPRLPPNPWVGTALGNVLRVHTRLNDARALNPHALGFLEAVGDRRFFLYVHYNDPHAPYRPSSEVWAAFEDGYDGRVVDDPAGRKDVTPAEQAHMERRYDAEVERALVAAAELFEWLRETGRWEDTLVVLTADHGEEFRDHGRWTHGKSSYQEMLAIPLWLHLPGVTPPVASRSLACSQVDVMPTVLDYLGLAPGPRLQGRSLRPDLEGAHPSARAPPRALSESDWVDAWSYQEGSYKIVVKDGERPQVALFDLSQDPGETRDLTRPEDAAMRARRSELLARGRQWRESLREAALPAVQRGLDDDLQADLRALGYIK